MLVIVSPAKKLDMDTLDKVIPTDPFFKDNVKDLILEIQNLSVIDLQKLMGISKNLAKLNANRFREFGSQKKKAAAFAFAGDTYKGFDALSLNDKDLIWAQSHFLILSGLYGILRPLDAIEPYRLEMGSRLKTFKGTSLYDYWGTQLSEALNKQALETKSKFLINCASHEYFSAIKLSHLVPKVITPVFMENKDGEIKIISFFAKKARGMFARYIVQNQLIEIEHLKNFKSNGYNFEPNNSNNEKLVFIRKIN